MEAGIRELLSDLVKDPTGEEMIRYQLPELARRPDGRVKVRQLLADVLDGSPHSSRRTDTASGESINLASQFAPALVRTLNRLLSGFLKHAHNLGRLPGAAPSCTEND